MLVIRMVTDASVEEHIIGVADQKRRFADSSITGKAAALSEGKEGGVYLCARRHCSTRAVHSAYRTTLTRLIYYDQGFYLP